MSTIQTNAIVDASGGNTTTVNGISPLANTARFGRNMIINGAMQVAQKGTTSGSEGYQTVDRFHTYKESCEQLAVTQSQSTTAPAGFGKSWKLDVTTAESAIEANDLYQIVTRLEGQDLQHLEHGSSTAKSVTLSFWVRSSKTGTYGISLYKRDSFKDITSTYTISSANTWEKKTVTFVGDSSSTIDNDNGRSLDITWRLLVGSQFTGTTSTSWGTGTDARSGNGHTSTWGSSTSDDFYLTGVQLEVGDTATDFEHLSYGEELAACQRYYYQIGDGTGFGSAQSGSGANAYLWAYPFRHPVPMRAAPTLSLISGGSTYFVGGIGVTIGTPTGDLGTVNTSSMSIPTSNKTNIAVHRLGLNGFSFTRGMGYGGTSGFIHCDAEI